MATVETAPMAPPSATGTPDPRPRLLVSLPSLSPEALHELVASLEQALPGYPLAVATPDAVVYPGQPSQPAGQQLIAEPSQSAPAGGGWHLSAADFLNAREHMRQFSAAAVMVLGAEAQSLTPEALAGLAHAVLGADDAQPKVDLAVARYDLPPRSGLVNSAMLYPLSRTLFATPARFPLAVDLCLSPRMADRLATVAERLCASGQNDAFLWPVSEAAVAGFVTEDVSAGPRTLPQPNSPDLNALLAQITSSLFTDIDAKAAWWQRARPVQPSRIAAASTHASAFSTEDVQPMLDTFRLAYGNLHEIWSLVLPPQTLLGLKRLAGATGTAPATPFRMADSLWARIVYDFVLAFRLRTINRNHLLGALTPLYLAWVASHILLTDAGTGAEQHIEAQAAAFEADKPYLVSRWRWPDRFNP